MEMKCNVCGKECGDVYRSYCTFACLNSAMQKMKPV